VPLKGSLFYAKILQKLKNTCRNDLIVSEPTIY
jgi:hypothetical protein